MLPADTTPTTNSTPDGSTTQDSANAIEGHSADRAEEPIEDTADATDATDADLLEVLSKDPPSTANLEQDGPAEAQTLGAASIEPASAPPRYPIQPEPDSAHVAPCYVFTLSRPHHKQHYYRTASFLFHDPTSPHLLCLRSGGVITYDTRTCFTVLFHR